MDIMGALAPSILMPRIKRLRDFMIRRASVREVPSELRRGA